MNYKVLSSLILTLCLAVVAMPQLLVLDGKALDRNRVAAKTDERLVKALRDLRSQADRLVAKARVYSVMDKKQVPPSGDKHDYMSQGPYWWPDQAKPNGLPYIRRDGERNPELNNISDAAAMDDMVG
ncbi:MAG: alginate lyase family protein, partial [Pyrinomonadaceae bacterium]